MNEITFIKSFSNQTNLTKGRKYKVVRIDTSDALFPFLIRNDIGSWEWLGWHNIREVKPQP